MGAPRMTFSFEKCLGQGGFGEVYLATLQRPGGLNKRVAVKVLKEELRNANEAVQRLRDEGRMLAILRHPCIVRVLEMTLIQGRVSLVTEYIDGIDLARCCKAPRLLPPRVVIGALGEVASGLNCAWTTESPETGKPLKLIHRDVKPENIRIGKHGEVKLLDFGIARTTEMFRHAKTAQGDLPFTPGYAAPEAFTKGFQGSASDVYALGVTLYRLVAGERFYEGMDLSAQVSTCCLDERYTPFLRQRLSNLDAPESIVQLLREVLTYEAIERPSALEMETRCQQISDGLEGPTHVRWARATEFPEPRGLPGGTLTGQVLEEDQIQGAQRPKSPRGVRLQPRPEVAEELLKTAPAPAHSGVVADLTPPIRGPELHPPSPNRTPTPALANSLPPPLPSTLAGNSIRPNTGPVSLQNYLPVPEDPDTQKMPVSTKKTLDGFVWADMETERVPIKAEDLAVLIDPETAAPALPDLPPDPSVTSPPLYNANVGAPEDTFQEEDEPPTVHNMPKGRVSVVPAEARAHRPATPAPKPNRPSPAPPTSSSRTSPLVWALAGLVAVTILGLVGLLLALVGIALGILLASL